MLQQKDKVAGWMKKKRLIPIVILFLVPLSIRVDCVFEMFLVFWSSAYKDSLQI